MKAKFNPENVLTPEQNGPGPLESLTLKDHCEMCGHKKRLEPAFNPSGQPMTLCVDCRIGSAELLADRRTAVLTAAKDLLAARDKTNISLRAALADAIAKAERR